MQRTLDIDTSAIDGGMGAGKKVYVRAIDETGSVASVTAESATATEEDSRAVHSQ